ncbi:UdgX family uracil-DNA binding protein [Sphingomonas sp.]|uniref:UdgX family uracil-DNA binding protein n=1 Tax=Sphingomonas sp. TaxID=28214 RepID=UPI00307EECEC
MHRVTLADEDDFDGWRDAARALAAANVPPEAVVWQVGDAPSDLFGATAAALPPAPGPLRVSRQFIDLARTAILHRDPARFALLYTLLLRLIARPGAIADRADPLIRRIEGLAKGVRRDIHKMRAFVRFRAVADAPGDDPRYVAWFEPEHHIVRVNARFFVDRFHTMHWSILTPALTIYWDGSVLSEGPGASRADAPQDDPVEAVWKSYYASIFNPARLKIGAMLKEMPRKYWKNMPETALVADLIKGARARELAMVQTARATAPAGDARAAWAALRDEAAACTRCPLHRPATATVFGEGPVDAPLMLVGEQPGDQEDLAVRPFVGPAGQLLDAALAEAGIDRAATYLTNAVKHFKFEPRGKRRIHATPDAGEISACRWWIEQELLIVRPRIVVALGATAARALLGRTVTIARERGRPVSLESGAEAWITVHPSYLLRLPDPAAAAEQRAAFVADLRAAAARL